jgi:hypothetical protein
MAPTCYPRCGKARKDSTNDVHLLVMPPPVPVRSVLASNRRDSARRCSRCPFRSTTSPTCGPCSGRVRNESAGRTLLRSMRSAPRSGRIERRQTQREGNCDPETDDYHDRLRRRSDAGTRRAGRGPQGRIRARGMGHAAVRQRGHDVSQPGLSCVNKLAGSSCAAARSLCGRLYARRWDPPGGRASRVADELGPARQSTGGQLHAP